MEKWEYHTLLCAGADLGTSLAALGEQGWEAVGFAPVVHKATDTWIGSMNIQFVTEWTAQQYRVLLKRRNS